MIGNLRAAGNWLVGFDWVSGDNLSTLCFEREESEVAHERGFWKLLQDLSCKP